MPCYDTKNVFIMEFYYIPHIYTYEVWVMISAIQKVNLTFTIT